MAIILISLVSSAADIHEFCFFGRESNTSKQSDWETIHTWYSRNIILQNMFSSANERILMPTEFAALWNLLNSVNVGMCELKKAVTANICVKTFKYRITCSFKSEGWVIFGNNMLKLLLMTLLATEFSLFISCLVTSLCAYLSLVHTNADNNLSL